jgi:ATP/ADP translocase/HEAT repeat protein
MVEPVAGGELGGAKAVAGGLAGLLGIRPHEGRRTALLFLYLFCASAIFILGRTARDTLFLSRYPVSVLPWMFVLFGVFSALVAIFYGAVSERASRQVQIQVALAVGAASYVAIWFAVRAGLSWIYPVFYVWADVVSFLLIMQFWTLANDLHDPRSAKRLFGTIGSARIIGFIVVGLSAGLAVKALGTEQLLLVMAGIMFVMAGLATAIGKCECARRQQRFSRGKGEPTGRLLRQPYVVTLCAMLLLIFLALTIGDYQFKMIARQSFREDALASFFSLFYAGAGLAGLLVQLFVTPTLLKRFGVLAALLVMPLCFTGSAAALLVTGGLAAACVMKFSDNGLQFTIHETAMQVLYVPFAPAVKAKARALLEVAVKPLSYGLGGLALVVLAALKVPVRQMAFVTLPVAILWLLLLPRVRRLYLRSLEASVSGLAGAFALDQEFVLDSESRKVLLRALDSEDRAVVLHAFDRLCAQKSPQLSEAIKRLCGHPDARVRRQALLRAADFGEPSCAPEALAALSDEDAEVRAAAIEAICSLKGDEAVDLVAPFLDDSQKVARVAATAGLITKAGVEGAMLGTARLQALLSSGQPAVRIEAADVLRKLGSPAYRPLRNLLRDPNGKVRAAAFKAAAATADPRLIPLLLQELAGDAHRRRASRALAAMGPPALEPLMALLCDGRAPWGARLLVPRIARNIADVRAFEALRRAAPKVEGQIRLRCYAAMGHLRSVLGLRPLPLSEVQSRVEVELVDAYGLMASWQVAKDIYHTELLEDFVKLRLRRAERRILRLLELRYDRSEVELVLRNLPVPSQRAFALEVLDNLMEPSLKEMVMPLFEELSVGQLLERAKSIAPPAKAPVSFLRDMCQDDNPYAALVAFHAAAVHREIGVMALALSRLDDLEPLAREGALIAVAALGGEKERARVAKLKEDKDPAVARLAQVLAAATEVPMYSTVEKILFLKSVPIFERLSGEDLAPLAHVAEIKRCAAGEVLFREGDLGDAVYVIMRGAVEIRIGGKTIARLGPKEAFGEMAVLEAQRRSASAVVAAPDTELLQISSDAFYEVLHEQVEIAEGIIQVLARRLREADEKLGACPR